MKRILAALLVLYAGAALAQGRDEARVYVFGNSLVITRARHRTTQTCPTG